MDTGHYHPTESVADKISSALCFIDELLLHVSRPVRWDSDHVVLLDEATQAIAQEIVRAGALNKVHIGLYYFDASINHVAPGSLAPAMCKRPCCRRFSNRRRYCSVPKPASTTQRVWRCLKNRSQCRGKLCRSTTAPRKAFRSEASGWTRSACTKQKSSVSAVRRLTTKRERASFIESTATPWECTGSISNVAALTAGEFPPRNGGRVHGLFRNGGEHDLAFVRAGGDRFLHAIHLHRQLLAFWSSQRGARSQRQPGQERGLLDTQPLSPSRETVAPCASSVAASKVYLADQVVKFVRILHDEFFAMRTGLVNEAAVVMAPSTVKFTSEMFIELRLVSALMKSPFSFEFLMVVLRRRFHLWCCTCRS